MVYKHSGCFQKFIADLIPKDCPGWGRLDVDLVCAVFL